MYRLQKPKTSLTLTEVFQKYFGTLGVPVLSGVKIVYCQPHFAIPLDVEVTLNATKQTIVITTSVR